MYDVFKKFFEVKDGDAPLSSTADPSQQPANTEPAHILKIADLKSVWESEQVLVWVMKDLIAEGTVNLLSSASGTGKTWVAYAIAGAVAHGREFIGRTTTQRPVLYVDGENPLFVVKERFEKLGIERTPNLHVWGRWCPDPPEGPGSSIIRDFVAEGKKPLLIWDSLVEFHPGNEQDSSETRRFMKLFRELAAKGATILILHHTGKSESSQEYRGSSDIEAAVDTAYHLKATDDKNALDELKLRPFKVRFAKIEAVALEFVEGVGFQACSTVDVLSKRATALAVMKEIVREEPGLKKGFAVARAMRRGVAKHDAEEALGSTDFDIRKGSKGNERKCYLKPPAFNVAEPEPLPCDGESPREQTAA
jgi:hypothetical protein